MNALSPYPHLHAFGIAMMTDAVSNFGMEPCTRAQAAAHEAGHVVIAQAVSVRRTHRVTVFETDISGRQGWLGENKTFDDVPAVCAAIDPAQVALRALHYIGGAVGEMIAGEYHPASSIEEIVLFKGAVAALMEDPLMELAGIMTAAKIINDNKVVFDAIRGRLMLQKKIRGIELRAFLRRIDPCDGYALWLEAYDRIKLRT